MLSLPNSSSGTLRPFTYFVASNSAYTFSPASVVVALIRLTTTSYVSSGWPCQFRVTWQNSRCSLLFHLLVPGGRWPTSISSPVALLSACSCTFHSRLRLLLLPPLSAVISTRVARGCRPRPSRRHQHRIASTANSAVSLLTPTLTHAPLWRRS